MATVIKTSTTARVTDAAPFNLDDLGQRAKEHLDQARRQAAEILAGAEQYAIQLRQQAEAQGRAAALEAARRVLDEEVGRHVTALVPALGEAIDRIRAAQAEWLLHWEKTAVHVATAIAGRVIRREVQRTPEITLSLVREALELAAGSADIQLRMHPDDVAALGVHVSQLAAEVVRLGKPEIVADPNIDRGGCRVDTRFGTIDQQFTAQLARIEQELT